MRFLLFVLALSPPVLERTTRPLFRGAGTGTLTVESVPENVPLEFYLVQCVAAAPAGCVFSVSRSGEKANPPTATVGQLYTESKTGVTFRIEDGDVDFAPGDAFSFATFREPKELDRLFEDWLEHYVKWIISREERARFLELPSAEDKLAFIESFWRRRDLTPETVRNERREEHQRRYQYALKHFGAGIPGWATDRGKIYILLGPPHTIQRNPEGRTSFERPSEVWTYNNPPNPRLPASLDIAFVDFTATGRYEIVSATNLDILAPLRTNIGYAMSELEAIGLLRSGGEVQEQTTGLRTPVDATRMVSEQFDWERDLREVARVPETERLSLLESVQATTAFPSLPLVASAVFLPGEHGALAPVTLALPYARLTPEAEGGDYRFRADILLRVVRDSPEPTARGGSPELSATGVGPRRVEGDDAPRDKPEGGDVLPPIEDRVDVLVPGSELSAYRENQLFYETSLTLEPGRYAIEAFLRDAPSGAYGRATAKLEVPTPAAFGLSSLILARGAVEIASPAEARAPFQFGSSRLIPSPEGRFRVGGTLTAYFEVHGYRRDGAPRLKVEYFILRDGRLFSKVAPSLHAPSGREPTGIKSEISLAGFPVGRYRLRARVTDEVAGATVEAEAEFSVEPP